jgi:hypothetical protein
MRYLIRFRIPNEVGNSMIRDAAFGDKMRTLLSDLRAEAAYFSTLDGQRGGFIVASFDDASKIPAMAEPLFLWLKADVDFMPVMLPEDLARAGSDLAAALKKWG